MNLLVTGCRGQLGNELRQLLEREMPGHTIYTDVDTLDLTDAAAVGKFMVDNAVTHIVNCAAYTAVDNAEEDGAACRAVNVDAVSNIARAAAENAIKVIHISTDYVFDGHAFKPYTETDGVNPRSRYGATKRQGETILLSMLPDAIVIRTAWLYSALGGGNFVKTMLRLGREQKELKVVYDQIGTPTWAADLAAAIHTMLRAPKWMPGVYHFTNEGVASWYDFAKAIHRLGGIVNSRIRPCSTEDYPTAATRPPYSVLSKDKIKITFGLTIPHWEESLARCIAQINDGIN